MTQRNGRRTTIPLRHRRTSVAIILETDLDFPILVKHLPNSDYLKLHIFRPRLLANLINSNYASPTVTNCTFSDNSAQQGGAIYNYYSSLLTALNCILWGDSASALGPELYSETHGYPDKVYPSRTTATYSIVQGGYSGTGNLDFDPVLNSDLIPGPTSPAIDAGDCGISVLATDILGNPRWNIASVSNRTGSNGVDIGAYEYQGSTANGDAIVPPALRRRPFS